MRTGTVLIAAIIVAFGSLSSAAQDSVADFYRGKTVRMVIGATPGGGYDTYARLLVRHLGKHIPGNPAVVPQNMPGASSNVAAIYIYETAPKDGLSIGAVTPGALMEPLLGDALRSRIDPSKFNFLGSATRDVFICIARKDAPISSFADVLSHDLVIGAVSEGGSARDFPLLLNGVLGTKFRIVRGYPGNRELLFAVEKGEVQGTCGNSYGGMKSILPAWFKPDGPIRILAQESMTGHSELNAAGVPLTISFAKTEAQKQMLSLLYEELQISRPYIMAPGTPPERVTAVRDAVAATLADPELLADAANMNLEIDGPLDGRSVQTIIERMYQMPADIVGKVRALMHD